MSQRIDFKTAAPGGYAALAAVQAYVNKSGLEHALLELVKMRASQINGCAFCLAMHSADAVKAGERHERLHLLPAWRETDLYTPRERAALAWTEALTVVAGKDVPDDVYEEARRQFSEKELVDLTYAVITINGWNRICIAFHIPPAVATAAAA
ncbi:MAG TPA: carboxymuconolactone decarboxylase family protein [Dongiaceae bacterium]|jgi:AhpD family alkylhydroperoxidase